MGRPYLYIVGAVIDRAYKCANRMFCDPLCNAGVQGKIPLPTGEGGTAARGCRDG
jgi:hypothetical protein